MPIKAMDGNNQSSFIPNSPKLEKEMNINRRMSTQNVVHPHRGTLHSHKKSKLLVHPIMHINHTTVSKRD